MRTKNLISLRRHLFDFIGYITSATIFCIISSCAVTSAQREAEIRNVLTEQWARYAAVPGASLSAMVITPGSEYFASTMAGVDATWHFRAGSTAKSFTAAAIMLLDQRGQLRIDDVITGLIPGRADSYIPATPDYDIPYKNQITIRQLLQHRAGVFDVLNNQIPQTVNAPYAGHRYADWVEETQGDQHTFTPDELTRVVAEHQLFSAPPGQEFHYSDTGYSILAKIVEEVSGKKLSQFLEEEFIAPNGLTDTNFPVDGSVHNLPTPFLAGFTKVDGDIFRTTERNATRNIGDGNTVTTSADLSRWFRRLIKGETRLSTSQIARMTECLPTNEVHVSYGLGIECNPPLLGYGHNGTIPGYWTFARHDPATDVTMVFIATLLDADDLLGQLDWIEDTAVKLRRAAGY